MENGKYLFFEKFGKAYIVKTNNKNKTKDLCRQVLDGFMRYNNLDYNKYTEKNINDTLFVINRDSCFVDLELKDDYISLKSKYFGGAYKLTDFVVC